MFRDSISHALPPFQLPSMDPQHTPSHCDSPLPPPSHCPSCSPYPHTPTFYPRVQGPQAPNARTWTPPPHFPGHPGFGWRHARDRRFAGTYRLPRALPGLQARLGRRQAPLHPTVTTLLPHPSVHHHPGLTLLHIHATHTHTHTPHTHTHLHTLHLGLFTFPWLLPALPQPEPHAGLDIAILQHAVQHLPGPGAMPTPLQATYPSLEPSHLPIL